MLLNRWKTAQYNCIVIIVNILACLVNRYTCKTPLARGSKIGFGLLYYCMRNFCNLIGLEKCYFSLI